MKVGTPGFICARLTEARQARGLNGTELAELIGVTPQSVSQYERDKQTPSPEMLALISDKLDMPVSYFMRDIKHVEPNPIFWRGKTTATRAARDRAEIRLIWLREIIDYLSNYFDYPSLNLPKIDLPRDFREIDTEMLELAASALRGHWGIGHQPMPDLLLEMENNGIIVSRILVGVEKLDAFSQWSSRYQIPFVVLSRDKASAVRQRFDAAHEAAHVLLHRGIDPKRLNSAADYKILEDQAHYFANALLLPADYFSNDLWSPTLDAMLSIKERWKVSVGAMIKRCEALGIVSDESARRLWINYNRRGWRTVEPLDGKIEKERPRLLRRSIGQLLEQGEQSVSQILSALPLAPRDIEQLCDLDAGTLTGEKTDTRAMPVLKTRPQPIRPTESNVVPLFKRKDSKQA
jgi:Zn-dependent peptidase ImmA (M78 family)/transcriptional regulator with XRE-family HTH domain